MAEGYVQSSTTAGIATVEFFHPSGNALPSPLLDQLASTIRTLGQAPEVRVIVLRSGGERAFCGGASLTELASITTLEAGKAFFSKFANVINAMRLCPRFIIGRVQGKAVGGGVGLIAATDYCLATQEAAVRLSELTVGIGPFVIEPAVRRKIGLSGVSHLTINATQFESAMWGWQKGLYNDVYPTAAELDEHVTALAQKLAAYDPEAMRQMKQVFWEGTDHWDTLLPERATLSGTLVLSELSQHVLTALKNR
jgi:methylglutaconyl-CoA hydratase